MRKAGSKEQFRKADLDYPVLTARLGKKAGAVQMLAISAMGADPNSRVFYNRTKGGSGRGTCRCWIACAAFVPSAAYFGREG